jgi:multidrug efflux pump subunit AcrA (membrane-fusion protein)
VQTQIDPATGKPFPNGDTVVDAVAAEDAYVMNGHGDNGHGVAVARAPSEHLSRQIAALQASGAAAPASVPPRSNTTAWYLRPRFLFMSIVGLVVLGGLGVLIAGMFGAFKSGDESLSLERVGRGNVFITIIAKGEIEASKNTEIICNVRSTGRGNNVATTIKWVIEEGTFVRKGERICLLDDSALRQQEDMQESAVAEKENLLVQAKTDLDRARVQTESDKETAANNVEMAKLDYEKQTKGNLESLRKDILGRIILAQADVSQWRDRVAWSNRMMKLGYLSPGQVQNDESKLRSAEVALEKHLEDQRVLESYDNKRTELEFRNKLEQAKAALKVAGADAEGKLRHAEANYTAKLRVLEQEQSALEKIKLDIRHCTILAPHDGMVVYHVPESSRFSSSGSRDVQIAVNEAVREGQKLMRIPDPSQMQAKVKIHESVAARVRGNRTRKTGFVDQMAAATMPSSLGWDQLANTMNVPALRQIYSDREEEIAEFGLPAIIRFPKVAKPLRGHVKMVSAVASSNDYSSDVKVYSAIVTIEDKLETLKPGMTAEVTILVDDTAENVLRLPTHAVMEAAGRKFCYVKSDDSGDIELRELNCGVNNGAHVAILDGSKVREGETVVMNPTKLSEKRKDLPAASSEENEFSGRKAGSSPAKPVDKPTRDPNKPAKPNKPSFEQTVEMMRGLSPEDRKAAIQKFASRMPPDNLKAYIKKLRDAGLEIPD